VAKSREASARPGGHSELPIDVQVKVEQIRRKVDVLPQLPPKLASTIALQLGPAQRASYELAEKDSVVHLNALGDTVTVQHVFELVMRLKQICNFCPASGESSKMDDLRDRLSVLASEGHKALIFSQFTNPDYGARRIGLELGGQALVYAGDLSESLRQEVLEEDFIPDRQEVGQPKQPHRAIHITQRPHIEHEPA